MFAPGGAGRKVAKEHKAKDPGFARAKIGELAVERHFVGARTQALRPVRSVDPITIRHERAERTHPPLDPLPLPRRPC